MIPVMSGKYIPGSPRFVANIPIENNSTLAEMPTLISELAPDLEFGDMIFFDESQVATMSTQEITSAIDRQVDIINKMKAKAGA
jgi:hypothetical protein